MQFYFLKSDTAKSGPDRLQTVQSRCMLSSGTADTAERQRIVTAEEWFDVVNEADEIIGRAPRCRCHGDPSLIHRTVHVVVLPPEGGGVLLQLRAQNKDIQPGKWDTAVGGHLHAGEDYGTAARREMNEELGLSPDLPLFFCFDDRIRNQIESENVRVFRTVSAGPFAFQQEEIDGVRFWSMAEIAAELAAGGGNFTPNLCRELNLLRESGVLAF